MKNEEYELAQDICSNRLSSKQTESHLTLQNFKDIMVNHSANSSSPFEVFCSGFVARTEVITSAQSCRCFRD